jgi:hypothetical protein
MHQDGSLPRARRDGILEETVGEELLLYDQDSHSAHCLSPVAACVWRHCDGEHDPTDLAQLAGASERLVVGALHELREKDLLTTEPQLTESAISGESRREAIVRAARYGAAAAAGSMIVSATAATPAMASSEGVAFCCECLNIVNKPCACTEIKSKSEAENKANCDKFCENETVLCSKLEDSLVKGGICEEASHKCTG